MNPVVFTAPPRPTDVNYDESAVGPVDLPDPLRCVDGTRVHSVEQWERTRRPELLGLFQQHVYGRVPATSFRVDVELASRDEKACGGTATRIELDVYVRRAAGGEGRDLTFELLLWVPNQCARPAPAFLGLNFFGNHTVHPDPAIRVARGWVPNNGELGVANYCATERSRGLLARRWPVELLLSRGYALATLYAGDIDPDYDDGFVNGAHGLLDESSGPARAGDAWGSVTAWSWGLSRALDALTEVERIDSQRVGVIGHSRLGKAALWAGARDERFAWTIANGSGRGGAAVSRRRFGELTRDLNARFPHWFAKNFHSFDGREDQLPIDQHELIALVAPRPVYVASASDDLWADPNGELLGCTEAADVYRLYGRDGVAAKPEQLVENCSIGDFIGYHRRPGAHDVVAADWWHFLNFADRHGGKTA